MLGKFITKRIGDREIPHPPNSVKALLTLILSSPEERRKPEPFSFLIVLKRKI